MKIGMVCYPTVGGSGVLATELGHQLAQRGHEVHFITYEVPFRLNLEDPNIFFHEVEISTYDLFKYPDYTLPLAVKMASVADCYNLELMHVHYAIPHATSAYLAKQLLEKETICTITTLHGTDINLVGREPSYSKIIKFSIEQSDGITAVSNSLKMESCCDFGIDRPIEVIYNFFIPKKELLGKKPMRHLFVEEGQKLLVHSSNYRSVKRPEDVLKIFKQVRKSINCRLLLIGGGNGLEDLRALASSEKLGKDVIFLGKSRDVDPYIASADLFLLPSSQESFGLAALEAMAYGVPVVATDVGGLPELVQHGKNGFLAPVGATDKMAEYAVQLLSDQKMYETFSKSASERAANSFNADKIVSQYEAYYKKICCKNKPRSNIRG